MSAYFYVSYGLLWVLVVVLATLMLLVYRHFGLMAMGTYEGVQRDGLSVGEDAPVIHGFTASGDPTTITIGDGVRRLVLFAATYCEPCDEVVPWVQHLNALNAGIEAIAIVRGPDQEATSFEQSHGPGLPTVAEGPGEVFGQYKVRFTPFAHVVGGDGRVLSKGLCGSATDLVNLLRSAGFDEPATALETLAAAADPDRHNSELDVKAVR
nr:lipoprotein dsbF [uncultured bacterium]